jgi:hypothetical protein
MHTNSRIKGKLRGYTAAVAAVVVAVTVEQSNSRSRERENVERKVPRPQTGEGRKGGEVSYR